MKIEILCGSGSPDGVHLSDLHGLSNRVGVGGSEYALLTLCEGWAKAGHEVVLYNNPTRQEGPFEQRLVKHFDKTQDRDILIVFREPTQKAYHAKGKVVFWSCDQYTVGDFKHFSQFAHKVVCISPFHKGYFEAVYGIKEPEVIDLPVRSWEYSADLEKQSHSLIFTSVPDRGLDVALTVFPMIKQVVPDATLTITSDYRLWGAQSPQNEHHIRKWMAIPGVRFLGAVPRKKLVEEQLKADIHFYPCVYDELFCIAVAESQVAGALPVTTNKGSLPTTNMGVVYNGDPRNPIGYNEFAQATIDFMTSPDLKAHQATVKAKALERFSLERIMKEWDDKIFA